MKDVKRYNRAVGKLLIVFGVVFALLGLPLLAGQGSLAIIISILGVVGESIAAMAVYILVIQEKYEKKPQNLSPKETKSRNFTQKLRNEKNEKL